MQDTDTRLIFEAYIKESISPRVKVCANCQKEVGLPPNIDKNNITHGICKRHALQNYDMILKSVTDPDRIAKIQARIDALKNTPEEELCPDLQTLRDAPPPERTNQPLPASKEVTMG